MNKKIAIMMIVGSVIGYGTVVTANADTIPVQVVKDHETVRGADKLVVVNAVSGQQDVDKQRISSTASPETNRTIRTTLEGLSKTCTMVAVPSAEEYTSRLRVGITPTAILGDHIHIVYPTINSVSPVVTHRINKKLANYATSMQTSIDKQNEKEHMKYNILMSYDIEKNQDGLLHIVMYTYTIEDNAIEGTMVTKEFIFNTTSGKSI